MSDAADARELKVGGTVDARTDVYIERREDKELLELLDRGEYCNILASRQVGKSSLMTRTMTTLQARGRQVALIDVAGNLGTPEKADDWYCGLLGEIARRVGHRMNVREWWARAEGTPNQRLIQFFREELLPRAEGGLIVMLDEIDHTLRFDYTDDLFTAIRSMYNERPSEPLFRRVAFCLAGVATPNELIKNQRTTAYNVGRTIELTDFDPADDDLSPLYRAMSVDGRDGEAIVKAILSWSGGHPYLTLRLCQEFLASGRTRAGDVDPFVAEGYAALERLSGDTHFQQISRFVKERLTNDVAAFSLYERLLSGQRERDQPTLAHTQLKLAGLVKRDARGDLVVRNRIYERVFNLAWVHYSTPLRQAVEQQDQLRQATTAASRRGRIAMWAGSALAGLIAAGIGYTTLLRAPLATRVLTELQSTADEQVAMANYGEIMDGGSAPTRWLWRMVYGGQATQAYSDFWQRRGASLDERALSRLKEGRIDEACMLGAAAAVKQNGPLNPEIQQAFDGARFAALQWTDARSTSGLPSSLSATPQIASDGSRVAIRFFDREIGGGMDLEGRVFELAGGRFVGASDPWPHEAVSFLTPDLRRSVRLAKDGSTVVTTIGGSSQSVLAEFAGPAQEGSRAAVVNDRHLAAVTGATPDGDAYRIRVWELATGKVVFDRSATLPSFQSISIDTGSRILATASYGGIRLYSLDSGRQLDVESDEVFTNASSRASRMRTRPFYVAFSPDGRRLLSAFDGRSVLWDTATGQRERVFVGYATVFSGDSRFLAGSAYTPEGETVAHLWDLSTPADARFVGSDAPVAMSVDGSRLALARSTLPNSLWIVDFRERDMQRSAVAPGARAAFSPDGKSVAISGPPTPWLRVWNVDELLGIARTLPAAPAVARAPNSAATPALTPEERWNRWQIKFGLTVDKNDEVVPLWQTRHDGRSGPVAIAGRPATIG